MSQPRTDDQPRPGLSVAAAAVLIGVSKGSVRHYVDNYLAHQAGDENAREPRLQGWRVHEGRNAERRVDPLAAEQMRAQREGKKPPDPAV